MNTYKDTVMVPSMYGGVLCVCGAANDAIHLFAFFLSLVVRRKGGKCVACRHLLIYLLVQIKFVDTFFRRQHSAGCEVEPGKPSCQNIPEMRIHRGFMVCEA